MKRSPELSALSRDHHRALYATLQLRRAARETATEARARDLRSESPLGELHELGERLKAHVRLEEEKLFPLIEETLEPAALGALGEELDRAERDEG
jgi:hemerythrin-like domain-containing protein